MSLERNPTQNNPNFAQEGLAGKIAKWTSKENILSTDIPGLNLYQWTEPTEKTSYMLQPSICLIAQGRKRLILGEESYEYDAHNFLITSVDLPVVSHVIEASCELLKQAAKNLF